MKYYQENPQAMQELQAPILEEKIIDYILELATVTERVVSTEELLADPDESSKADQGGRPRSLKRQRRPEKRKRKPRRTKVNNLFTLE